MADRSSELLSQTTGDLTSVLESQLRTLEQTKKISRAIPILQRSTQEASTWLAELLDLVKSFPNVQEDMFNIKENVQTLTRLVLGKKLGMEACSADYC